MDFAERAPALATRLDRVQQAATVVMLQKARALAARGIEVISLAIGEPDYDSPRHAIDAAYAAALAGDTKYPPQSGTDALKAAVRAKFKRDQGLDYAADEVAVSNGGKQAIFNAIMATIDDGDEVVIPAPYWAAYPLAVKLAGGEPVFVTCPQNNGFRLRPEDLEAAITPRTKWFLLNQPNNPTGAAYSPDELRALGEVLARHPHVWIMADDMYEHLIYDGRFTSLAAACPDLRDRTLTITGASKTYAMTGWRVGYYAGPARLVKAMVNVQGHATAGVSTIGQAAAAAALTGPQDGVAAQVAGYRARRDVLADALNACPGVQCHKPEGAFYLFPSIAGCIGRTSRGGARIATDADFCEALLDEGHVAAVHGGAFGMSPYMRLSYATDDTSVAEAGRRIRAFCDGLH